MKDDSDLLWLERRTESVWATTPAGQQAWECAKKRAEAHLPLDAPPSPAARPKRWRAVRRGALAGTILAFTVAIPAALFGPSLLAPRPYIPDNLRPLGAEPVVLPASQETAPVMCQTASGETRISVVPRAEPWFGVVAACAAPQSLPEPGAYDVCAVDPYVIVAVPPGMSRESTVCAGGNQYARVQVSANGEALIVGSRR